MIKGFRVGRFGWTVEFCQRRHRSSYIRAIYGLYTYTYICIYIYAYIYMGYVHIYLYLHTDIYTYTHMSHIHRYMYIHVTYTYIYICICACIYIYIHLQCILPSRYRQISIWGPAVGSNIQLPKLAWSRFRVQSLGK